LIVVSLGQRSQHLCIISYHPKVQPGSTLCEGKFFSENPNIQYEFESNGFRRKGKKRPRKWNGSTKRIPAIENSVRVSLDQNPLDT
jgi:hypothetical protein